MKDTTNDFVKIIENVIYTIERHTITKPEEESEQAMVEVYKVLYQLKDYFEDQNR